MIARGQTLQLAAICNLTATIIWITIKFETTSALERPIHVSLLVLGFSGLLWYVCDRARSQVPAQHDDHLPLNTANELYETYELNESDEEKDVHAARLVKLRIWKAVRRSWRSCYNSLRLRVGRQTGRFVLLVVCIIARTIISQAIIWSVQCSWSQIEILLPLVLLLYERIDKSHSDPYSKRYVITLAIWVLSATGVVTFSAQSSTYICPLAWKLGIAVRFCQCLRLLLDSTVIITASRVLKEAETIRRPWVLLSRVALASALVIALLASTSFWNLENITWSLRPPRNAVIELLLYSLLYTNCLASTIYLLSDLRPRTIFTLISCVSVYTSHFPPSRLADYAPRPSALIIILCATAYVSVAALLRLERDASWSQRSYSLGQSSSKGLMIIFICMSCVFFFGMQFIHYSSPNRWESHPIEKLIANADQSSHQWLSQATTSKSLDQAVSEYQSRYGIPPPPKFDIWYEYATSRGSIIIDDFAQINDDLLPFWGLEPKVIREMTSHMMERPWTDIGSVRIANGTTSIGPHMPPTHRWMVEGATFMINQFSQWLPDMDIAFNINDESRVTVPWPDMEKHLQDAGIARQQLSQSKNLGSFSDNIVWGGEDTIWREDFQPNNEIPAEFFFGSSFRPSFKDFGSIGCPPDSPARIQTRWNQQSFCSSCAAPHSLGGFVSNWTLSGSLCHQPDLQNLHGVHLSPAAFKPTTKLFPIFSQSKVPTYADIIFPSPWNYQDKVTYDASQDFTFSRKDNTLFWRGATSEGMSVHGTWEGMQRQRFVHLVNFTPKSRALDLLLSPGQTHGYSHHSVPLSQLQDAINISVAFVGEPVRCRGLDCPIQNAEFNWASQMDFQEHWQYKYLFDLDGAGFSGRFLPFLQSESLVFRAASFRQWFDERLTAWKHFVPVDPRLHDVWGMLAFFGGVGKEREGHHDVEAERIAGEGRQWAGRVLGKVDMEVYMFRLLLEWGRIVDDRRENLGFILPNG
ncbi:hypothetical protein BJ875DRAFT_121298 [Amylocarpus encephaloides]|uniref:Glycosyl transferase CAP10 domain-containing protein n=1 Tax=Amylocarpus encephaloides TaxID=45428 RepID=A0A9P7YQC2_9HELO|nr:hypothetical protein BJ875DRAFT_121298 [Amylocarpus encephaloides]